MLAAGRLTERISIEKQTPIFDSLNQKTDQWVKVVETWAEVKPLRGDERVEAMRFEAPVTHRIRLRDRESLKIDTTMRIKTGGQTLYLTSVLKDGDTLELLAS